MTMYSRICTTGSNTDKQTECNATRHEYDDNRDATSSGEHDKTNADANEMRRNMQN